MKGSSVANYNPLCGLIPWQYVSQHPDYHLFQNLMLFLSRYLENSWMFVLSQSNIWRPLNILVGGQPPTVWWACQSAAEVLRSLPCLRCWSACTVQRCTRCFSETLFNGKNTVSCIWLINAECCISLFNRDTNESQPWHTLISSFVTICFHSVPSAWCSFDRTIPHHVWTYFDPPL